MRATEGHHPRRRSFAARGAGLAAVAALALVVAACMPPPDDRTLQVSTRVSGFERPWDLQFTPDGTALVTERAGTLAASIGGQRRVVGTVPGVRASGEGGLMGLAVDPLFSTNRWIYVCYSSTSADVRVVRFSVSSGYNALTSPTPIVTGIPTGVGNRHQGCRVAFGPNGAFWVTTGDGAIGTAPADRSNLAGKVLRMTKSGAPYAGNPASIDPGAGWHPLVFSRGHRNPQGIAFRPSDGTPFTVEHGTGCDDEVNLLVTGADYGWNPAGAGGAYDESKPMTAAGATPAVWKSGCPTIAPSGATFLRGSQWGAREGALVVAVLKGQRLMLLRTSGSTVTSVETQLTTEGRLRSTTLGPDGSLWVVPDAANASLLQVVPK